MAGAFAMQIIRMQEVFVSFSVPSLLFKQLGRILTPPSLLESKISFV